MISRPSPKRVATGPARALSTVHAIPGAVRLGAPSAAADAHVDTAESLG